MIPFGTAFTLWHLWCFEICLSQQLKRFRKQSYYIPTITLFLESKVILECSFLHSRMVYWG